MDLVMSDVRKDLISISVGVRMAKIVVHTLDLNSRISSSVNVSDLAMMGMRLTRV